MRLLLWARTEPVCATTEVERVMKSNEHEPYALLGPTPIGDAAYVLKLIRELELRLWGSPVASASPLGQSAVDDKTVRALPCVPERLGAERPNIRIPDV